MRLKRLPLETWMVVSIAQDKWDLILSLIHI